MGLATLSGGYRSKEKDQEHPVYSPVHGSFRGLLITAGLCGRRSSRLLFFSFLSPARRSAWLRALLPLSLRAIVPRPSPHYCHTPGAAALGRFRSKAIRCAVYILLFTAAHFWREYQTRGASRLYY